MSKSNNAAEMQQSQENAANMQQSQENAAEMQQNETENAAPVQKKDPYQELVRFKLPIIKGEREDVLVGVNGKFWQIKRGEYVDLPRPVFEVLENQEKMEKLQNLG